MYDVCVVVCSCSVPQQVWLKTVIMFLLCSPLLDLRKCQALLVPSCKGSFSFQ